MTTHGRLTAWRMEHVADYGLAPSDRAAVLESYRSTGFGYCDQGQHGYGISVSSPAWALGQVRLVVGDEDYRHLRAAIPRGRAAW